MKKEKRKHQHQHQHQQQMKKEVYEKNREMFLNSILNDRKYKSFCFSNVENNVLTLETKKENITENLARLQNALEDINETELYTTLKASTPLETKVFLSLFAQSSINRIEMTLKDLLNIHFDLSLALFDVLNKHNDKFSIQYVGTLTNE